MSPRGRALPACIVLATGNPGKLREMRAILAPWGVDVRPLSEFTSGAAEEAGLSFVENAILKARFAAQASGLPAIADDSGLEVDALHGAPGIYSARYAGPGAGDAANNARLLEQLATVRDIERAARYQCAMAFMRWPLDPSPIVRQASWEGRIAHVPRGGGGFGYDPLFLVGDGDVTAAQLDAASKNEASHRGRALRALVAALTEPGGGP